MSDDIRNLAAAQVAKDLLNEANGRLIEFRESRKSVTTDRAGVTADRQFVAGRTDKIAALEATLATIVAMESEVMALGDAAQALKTVAAYKELVQDAATTLEGIHSTLLQIAADYADLSEKFTSVHGFGE